MKKYTSWGEFIQVVLKNGKTYDHVIICPNPSNNMQHILEAGNGETIIINTKELKTLKRENGYTFNVV